MQKMNFIRVFRILVLGIFIVMPIMSKPTKAWVGQPEKKVKKYRWGWDLAVDVYENNGDVVVKMQIPGIDAKDIKISVEDRILKVSGNREEKVEETGKSYYREEIKKGSFERIIKLPVAVKGDLAEATCNKHGILKIVLPKKKQSVSEEIRIKIED